MFIQIAYYINTHDILSPQVTRPPSCWEELSYKNASMHRIMEDRRRKTRNRSMRAVKLLKKKKKKTRQTVSEKAEGRNFSIGFYLIPFSENVRMIWALVISVRSARYSAGRYSL